MMKYSIRSYIGTRAEQQDSADAVVSEKGIFAVLCDGMGGRKYGADISRTVVDEICFRYSHSDGPEFIPFMTKQTEEFDRKIGDIFKDRGGTTLVSVFVDNEGYVSWFSLGDSRSYLIRKGSLVQLTDDHNYFSLLDERLAKGLITEQYYNQEAHRGHALTSFLGVNGISQTCSSSNSFRLEAEDTLLLTSDGLYNALPPEMIAELLSSENDTEKAADLLIDRVRSIKDRAVDNTTFILIRIGV